MQGKDVIVLKLEPDTHLSVKTKAYFALCEEKLGLVPNVLKAYAFNEDKLNTFTHLYNDLMLGDSNLTKLQREMIAVVVSSINKCYYCLAAHGAAVRQLSANPELGEMLVMNFRAADLEPQEMAMLIFCEKLTKEPESIVEEDRQGLRDSGWGDRDIWDIANIAAFFNMTNRVASATDMRPNTEYHSRHR